MKKKILTLTIISSLFLSGLAYGDEKIVGHELPLDRELLASPIKMCEGFTIIEWRKSESHPLTSVSRLGKDVAKVTCNTSLRLFDSFIAKRGLKKNNNKAVSVKVSLMPWDVVGTGDWGDGDGVEYRNLNDANYRFKFRAEVTGPHGGKMEILGSTFRELDFIAMRNDPLNDDGTPNKLFMKVLSHEIFHALSDQYGIYKNLGKDKHYKDEQLALEFDAFVMEEMGW